MKLPKLTESAVLATLQNNEFMLLAWLNPTTQIQYFNKGFETFASQTWQRKPVCGESLHELVTAEDGPILHLVARARNGESCSQRSGNGMEWHAAPAEGETGSVLLSAFQNPEVEELHLGLNQIKLNLKYAEELASLGYWHWNVRAGTVEWSQNLKVIFGLQNEKEPFALDTFLHYVHEEDKATVQQCIYDALEQKCDYNIRHRIVTKDGQLKTVHCRGLVDFAGTDPLHMFGVVMDMTGQLATGQELMRAHGLVNSILHNLPGACVHMFDPDGKFLFVNGSLLKQLNIDAERSKGLTLREAYGDEMADLMEPYHKKVMQGESNSLDFSFNNHNIRTHFAPLLSQQNDIIGGLQFSTDITALKQNEAKLMQLNESKDRIIYTVAHDLKNPIGLITSLVRVMKMSDNATLFNEETNEYIGMIEESCGKATSIINELLEIAALESDNFKLEKLKTDLSEMVRKIAGYYCEHAQHKGIKLVCNEADKELFVSLDSNRFNRVLDNLVHNALKFTPTGGTISLRTFASDNHACVEIKDSGIGIPHNLRPMIFDKFTKAKRLGLHGETSTGLGMSIVKQIVELHGGHIRFDSEEGLGTSFTIRLPLQH